MRASSDLNRLRQRAVRRTNRLIGQTKVLRKAPPFSRTTDIGFLVVELDNLIINFQREFMLSVLLRSRTCDGLRITTSVTAQTEQEAIQLIFRAVNPVKLSNMQAQAANRNVQLEIERNDELKIRNPKEVEKVLIAYQASNINSYQNALSLNAKVFGEIATVRNFYAHRNPHTKKKVLNIARNNGLISVDSADSFCLSRRPSQIASILSEWLFDVRDFVDFSTQ